jgi:hypothetical protein
LSDAPDLFEPVLGWRCWIVVGSSLRSIAMSHVWQAEEQAVCKRAETDLYHSPWYGETPARHAAPADYCACGLYAYHDPWSAENHRRKLAETRGWQVVMGAVEMWGNVLVHGTGVRAEHARLLGLAMPPPGAPSPAFPYPLSNRPGRLGWGWPTPVETIAKRYGVPALPLPELIERVSEGRGAVPVRLFPATQPPLPPPPLPLTARDLALPALALVNGCLVVALSSALAVRLIWLVAIAVSVAAIVTRLLAR